MIKKPKTHQGISYTSCKIAKWTPVTRPVGACHFASNPSVGLLANGFYRGNLVLLQLR